VETSPVQSRSARSRGLFFAAGLAALLALVVVYVLLAGDYGRIPPGELPGLAAALFSGEREGAPMAAVFELRLARACLALLVGGGLSLAGAAMQGFFRNPLADPGLIGVSTGASLGAAVWFVLLAGVSGQGVWGMVGLPVFAMGGGIAMTFLIFRLARVGGRTDVTTMLLIGVAASAMGAAVIGLMQYLATFEELRRFTFWSMGSLARATWWRVLGVALFVLPLGLGLLLCGRVLNALLLGEREAWHLGFDVARWRAGLIFLSAGIVGATVAGAGMIGLLALVVPHLIRVVYGPDHRFLLPASVLLGGFLLLGADLAARTLPGQGELPIGILTSLCGGPFFIWLLLRQRGRLFI